VLVEFPVRHPDKVKCYNPRNDNEQKSAIDCPTDATQMVNNALGFTFVAQDLLFKGQLRQFADLY